MRHIITVAFIFFSFAALASTQKEESGILLKTKLSYKSLNGVIEAAREFILSETNRGWTPLTSPKNGVILLGKLAKADTDKLRMEYMLVDTNSESSIIATPAIIARYGQEAIISINSKEKIIISFLAKKTLFHAAQ